MKYVRVYVRQVRAGTLAMGSREVFVLNSDSAFVEVYSVASGDISYLDPEDYESAVDRVITPKMAQSILRILDGRKKSLDVKTQDAELDIRRYVSKLLVPSRQRTRRRVEEKPTPRVRTRKRVEQEKPKVRKRVRSRS